MLDPERLFGDAGYLIEVAMGDRRDEPPLAAAAARGLRRADPGGRPRQSTGQALSRLLNLTDGLLGQGRNVLVAITTNEDLARLHPAVTRPGALPGPDRRSDPLPYTEAVSWLGRPAGIRPAGRPWPNCSLCATTPGRSVTSRSPPTGLYL